MRLGDGPEYEFEKIDEIKERDVILVLENAEGDVVRISVTSELNCASYDFAREELGQLTTQRSFFVNPSNDSNQISVA